MEAGKEVIERIADLLRSEFKPENHCLNPPIFPRDIFSRPLPGNLEDLSLLPENLRQYIASKGLPQEMGEIIAIAVANRIAGFLIQESKRCAEDIVNKENTQSLIDLDRKIEELSQKVTLLGKKIAEAESSNESLKRSKEIEDQRKAFDEDIKAVQNLFYRLTQIEPEETSSKINKLRERLSNFRLLMEKRKFLTSQIEISQNFFEQLDSLISELFSLTDKERSIFKNFGINPSNFLIEGARKHLQSVITQSSPSEIFEFGYALLRSYNFPVNEIIREQVALFGRYEKSNPEQAKNIALDFASRMMILHLLTFGSTKSEQTVNTYWPKNTVLYTGFFKYFPSILTQNFNTIPSVEERKKMFDSEKDKLAAEQKALEGMRLEQSSFQAMLNKKREEKERLNFPLARNQRIKELIASYIQQALGLPGDYEILEGDDLNNIRLKINSIFCRSPFYQEILKSLFEGLPKFIPPPEEGKLRESARAYYKNLLRHLPEATFDEFFNNSPDYLQRLVQALIPDHPDQETASKFIERILWHYSFNPRFQRGASGASPLTSDLSHFLGDVLSGSRILYFSDHNLPRIDLDPLIQNNWRDNPETSREVEELRKFITNLLTQHGLDPSEILLVSETKLFNTDFPNDPEKGIRGDRIYKVPWDRLLRILTYFKPPPQTGKRFQGIYAIESQYNYSVR